MNENSIIDVLQPLQELISSITKSDDVTEPLFKYVSEDWGQLDNYNGTGTRPPVKFPCCLISVLQASFTDLGPNYKKIPVNRQQGTYTIVLTVANEKLTNGSQSAPLSQQLSMWDIHRIKNRLHNKVHGWLPFEDQSPLLRQSERKMTRQENTQEYDVYYTIGLTGI